MRLKITKDFRAFEFDYGLNSGFFYSDEVMQLLKKNAGKWFEVDDRHLFKDQYILKPDQALSKIRITDLMVDKIEQDARVGVNVCFNCGSINISGLTCHKHPSCSDIGVLNFNDKNTYFLRKHRIIKPLINIDRKHALKVSSSFKLETFNDLFILRSNFDGIVIFKVTPSYFLIRSGFGWIQTHNVPDKNINGLPDIRYFLKSNNII